MDTLQNNEALLAFLDGKGYIRIEITEKDWPRCHICDMPVMDFFGIQGPDGILFVAACHNEIEVVKLSDNQLVEMQNQVLEIGWAFQGANPNEQTKNLVGQPVRPF